MEKERLSRMGVPLFHKTVGFVVTMSVPSAVLFFMAGGWIGIAALATVWVISNFELEALNYLEHYGLTVKE